MNKLLLTFIFGILLLGVVSAESSTTILGIELNPFAKSETYLKQVTSDMNDFIKEDFNNKYGVIRLSNTFFWIETDKIAEYSLTSNTEQCLFNCEARGKITLYKQNKIFSDIIFRDTNGNDIELNNYNIQIKNIEQYVDKIPIYKEVCVEDIKNNSNSCNNIVDGYNEEIKYRSIWKDYNNEELPIGNYEWKISASKNKRDTIDFIPIINNNVLNAWAWWNSTQTFKSVLNFTTSDAITSNYTHRVTFLKRDAMGSNCQNLTLVYKDTTEIDSDIRICNTTGVEIAWKEINNIAKNTYDNNYSVYYGITITRLADNNRVYQWNDDMSASNSSKYSRFSNPGTFSGGKVCATGNSRPEVVGNINFTKNFTVEMAVDFKGAATNQWYVGLANSPGTIPSGATPYVVMGGNAVRKTSVSGVGQFGSSIIGQYTSGTFNYTIFVNDTTVQSSNDTLIRGGNYDGKSAFATTTGMGANWANADSGETVCIDFLRIFEDVSNRPTYSLGIEMMDTPSIIATKSFPNSGITSNNRTILIGCNFTSLQQNISNVKLNVYNSSNYLSYTNTIYSSSNLTSYDAIWMTTSLNDNSYNWACYGYGGAGYNVSTTNNTYEIHADAPIITLYYPNGTYNFGYVGLNLSFNYSISDLSIGTCWYEYESNNITTSCSVNSSFLQNISKSLRLYANDTVGNIAYKDTNWSYILLQNANASYNPITTSGISETFSINISYLPTYIVNVNLNYNNTLYTMTSSDNSLYTTTINVPIVTATINKSFAYNITATDGVTTTIVTTNFYNQTIYPFAIDNCTTYTKKILKLDLYDEETLIKINGTIQYLINFYTTDRLNLISTFNNTINYLTTNTYEICAQNITGNYSLDYQIKYYGNSSIYFNKYRNIQNRIFGTNSIAENVTLYDLLIANGNTFQIYVRGSSIGNTGLLVNVLKQYVAKDEFLSVESPVTDVDGNAIVRIIPSSEIYSFIVSYNGAILGTFNNYQLKCANPSTGDCPITLNLAETPANTVDFTNFGNISGVLLINNNTNILYYTFSTSDSNSHTVRQEVVVADGFNNQTICDQTTTTTSGTYTCAIPVIYQETTLYSKIYSDGTLVGTQMFMLGNRPDFQGVEVFISILLYTSTVLLMISSPILTMIGAVLGFIFLTLLLFIGGAKFSVMIGALIYLIIVAIIMIIRMNRRNIG